MKMKWSVIILVILGVFAALSASLLVNALRHDTGTGDDSLVEVVVAKRPLPAMFVISARHVVKDRAPKDELPGGYLTDLVQAVGKVLSVPVVEGQVLTKYCFVTEGTGAQLASALPPGMRAVSVSIPGHSLMGGLLHPGCVVDVLATFKLRAGKESRGQAISTTLLQGVQVLAIESSSIVSKSDEEGALSKIKPRAGSRLTVTLMVDTKQAEALQLAMENGQVSLAMRNPLDKRPINIDATVLSQGRLAKLGSLLTPSVAAQEDIDWLGASEGPNSVGRDAFSEQSKSSTQLRKLLAGDLSVEERGTKPSPQWEVTVIRGREVTEEVLDVSSDDSGTQKSEEE
jgi:pilus assembly protein CpaB